MDPPEDLSQEHFRASWLRKEDQVAIFKHLAPSASFSNKQNVVKSPQDWNLPNVTFTDSAKLAYIMSLAQTAIGFR